LRRYEKYDKRNTNILILTKMTADKIGNAAIEAEAGQIIAHLQTLDNDALVEASHDMDLAIRGEGHGELPLWLRGLSREAVEQARFQMLTALSATSKSDKI